MTNEKRNNVFDKLAQVGSAKAWRVMSRLGIMPPETTCVSNGGQSIVAASPTFVSPTFVSPTFASSTFASFWLASSYASARRVGIAVVAVGMVSLSFSSSLTIQAVHAGAMTAAVRIQEDKDAGGGSVDQAALKTLVTDSVQAFRAGDYETSIKNFLAVIAKDDNVAIGADARYYLGQSYYQLSDYRQAILAFDSWISTQPDAVKDALNLSAAADSTFADRRNLLAEALNLQAYSHYHLGLEAEKISDQFSAFGKSGDAATRLIQRQPSVEIVQQAQQLKLLTVLQQLIREPQATQADFQAMAEAFGSLATSASLPSVQSTAKYYQAITQKSAGQVQLATDLLDALVQDLSTPAQIKVSAMLGSAENRLEAAINNPMDPSSPAQLDLVTAGVQQAAKIYIELQESYPAQSPDVVAYNLGMCFKLLGDSEPAITQFEKLVAQIDRPAQIQTSAGLVWSAGYNQARCYLSLGQMETALEYSEWALSGIDVAPQALQADAVVLRMRIAENADDFPTIAKLQNQFQELLSSNAQLASEVIYLTALWEGHDQNKENAQKGLQSLEAIAQDSANQFNKAALLEAAELRFQSGGALNRQFAARPNFDQEQKSIFESNLGTCVAHCEKILALPEFSGQGFPQNPANLNAAQLAVLESRKRVQNWLADSLFGLGKFPAATAVYQQLMQDNASDSLVGTWLVNAATGMANSDQASAALTTLAEEAVQKLPATDQAAAYFVRGQIQENSEQFDDAARSFEKSFRTLKSFPLRVNAINSALFLYNQQGDFAKVIGLANELEVDLDGIDLAAVKLQRGTAYFGKEQFDDAKNDFVRLAEVLASVPTSEARVAVLSDGQFNLGMTMLRLNQESQAKNVLLDFVRSYPSHYQRAAAISQLQRLDSNLKAADFEGEKVASTDLPKTLDAGDPKSVDPKMAETSGKLNPALDADFAIGNQQLAEENWVAAEATFAQLVRNAGSDSRGDQFLYNLFWARRKSETAQSTAQAKLTLENFVATYPESSLLSRAAYYLGRYQFDASDFVNAELQFSKATKVTDDSQLQRNATYMLAWTEFSVGKYENAADGFSQWVKNNSSQPLADEARLMIGQSYFANKDYDKAFDSYRSALANIQDLAKVKSDIRWTSLINATQAAIQTDHFSIAEQWLGALDLNQVDFLAKNSDLTPTAAHQLWFQAGYVQRGLNDLKGAKIYFRKLVALPNEIGARSLFALGEISKVQGLLMEAKDYFGPLANGAYGESPSAEVQTLQAEAGYEMGLILLDLSKAQTDFAVQGEYRRQAKIWLTRAQIQTISLEIAKQAAKALSDL